VDDEALKLNIISQIWRVVGSAEIQRSRDLGELRYRCAAALSVAQDCLSLGSLCFFSPGHYATLQGWGGKASYKWPHNPQIFC
jgi:hypothetical protein